MMRAEQIPDTETCQPTLEEPVALGLLPRLRQVSRIQSEQAFIEILEKTSRQLRTPAAMHGNSVQQRKRARIAGITQQRGKLRPETKQYLTQRKDPPQLRLTPVLQ